MKMLSIIAALLLFVVGCSKTGSREYTVNIPGNNNTVTLELGTGDIDSMNEADSQQEATIPIATDAARAATGAIGAGENLIDRMVDARKTDSDNTTTTNPQTPAPTVGGNDEGAASDETQTNTETIQTKWSEDRGRYVAWLKDHCRDYYWPVSFEVSGKTYEFPRSNETEIDGEKWNVVDDFHYGCENHDKAEILLPKGVSGVVKMRY